MTPREGSDESFVMVHQRDLEATLELLAARRLELRDMAVFTALMALMNVSSGRVYVSAQHVADRLKISLPVCVSSITRLRRELLVSRVKDPRTGDTYFLLNPYVASVGGPQRRGLLWAQFSASLE